ncbi:MAG: MFS transporter [Gammaproteobacteria bacterium]|nr:MFS transporter [Gammaproteobacteria bacterium]
MRLPEVKFVDRDASTTPPAAGFGTPGYRAYVLNMLLLVYVLNFVDRGLLAVVARPLKAEIEISDTAWGLLTGFGFALLYTTAGIPIARLAETRNRVWIMAVCLAFWSLMTVASGLAADIAVGGFVISGFWVLLVCRIGVGLGEAGGTPPANSLIADYFPPRRRPAAIGYYAMGVTLGTLLANLVGGPVADWFGWRAAFLILGLPGVAVAVVLVLTTREPPRGYTDPPHMPRPAEVSLRDGWNELLSRPAYWWMTAGATIAAFCGYAIVSFQALYLQRSFDLTAGEAALQFSAPAAAAGALGTWLMGQTASALGERTPGAVAWLAAAGLLAAIPFYFLAFTASSLWVCAVSLSLAYFVKYGYIGAQFTITQGVVSMRVRATATAVLLFIVNLVGYGLGPLFAGIVSDASFARAQSQSVVAEGLTRSMCDAAQQQVTDASRLASTPPLGAELPALLAELPQPITAVQYGFCLEANASSTQFSMLLITSLYVLAALAFVASARRLRHDLQV